MGSISKSGFTEAINEATQILRKTGRQAEHILAHVWQVNAVSQPTIAKQGELVGKKVILAGISRVVWWRLKYDTAELVFSCGGAHTQQHWMELDEFSRIKMRTKKIIGVLPSYVQYYLCGSTRPE